MSTRYNCPETVTGVRLSVVAGAATNLTARLFELNELRERSEKRSYRFEDSGAKVIEKEHAEAAKIKSRS
jgi:hypothetical protein